MILTWMELVRGDMNENKNDVQKVRWVLWFLDSFKRNAHSMPIRVQLLVD